MGQTIVDFGTDGTHAEDFARTLRLCKPPIPYRSEAAGEYPGRTYRLTIPRALSEAQLATLHEWARGPIDPATAARDALAQMRRFGTLKASPGVARRLREISRSAH
jgi:hypothetical protein